MTELEKDMKNMNGTIWHLAWPAILRMAFQTSVGIITMFLVGNYFLGAEAVAAIGLAQRITFLVIGTLSALGIGTTALVANYYGAGKPEKAREVVSQSIIIGVVMAAILAVLLNIFGSLAMGLLMLGNPDPAVIAMGSGYLKIIGYSMLLGLPMMIINAAQQGAGDMKTPMYMMIAVNLLTIILGIYMIPRWGLSGAGLAEGLSRVLGGIFALWSVFNKRFAVNITPGDLRHWKPEVAKNILSIGVPAAGEQFARQSSQIIYTIMIAGLGTMAIAANQVVMTIQSISFMPGFGFGLAATTLVGQSLGAGKEKMAQRYGYQINKFALGFMAVMGVVFFIWAEPLAALFVPEPEVAALAAACLRIVAFAQIPFSVVMVLSGALRGAGDTKWVMYLTTGGQWGIRLVVTWILIRLGLGLRGAWVAMLLDVTLRCFLTLWRFRSGNWKNVLHLEETQKSEVRFSEG